MKLVELELSARQLNTLVYCFNTIGFTYPRTRQEKVLKSILDEVIVKVKKKHIDIESGTKTLFTKPKKAKFKFKLHEADSIEQFLLMAQGGCLNDYDRSAVIFITNKLNQQMA